MEDFQNEWSALLEERKNWEAKMANLRSKMLEECVHLIKQFDFTAEELGFGRTTGSILRGKKPRKSAPPKFQSPYESGVPWNGTGRAPRWYVKAKQEGFTDELLRIEKPAQKEAAE